MYNQLFHMTSLKEKQNKLARVLKNKSPFISDEHLNKIIDFIDFDKQYTIKVTSNIEKFKNIVVSEHVETETTMFRSISTSIYGEFIPGLFENIYGTITKIPSKSSPVLPKAVVKEIIEQKNEKKTTSYHLVIYCPPKDLMKIS